MQHDTNYILILASLVFSVITAYVCFGTLSRAKQRKDSKVPWLLGGGATMGLGIWMVHYIGMIFNNHTKNIIYDFDFTLASAIMPIITSIIMLFYMTSRERWSVIQNLFAAGIMFLGMVAMYALSTWSLQMSTSIRFDPIYLSAYILTVFLTSFLLTRFAQDAAQRIVIFSYKNILMAAAIGISLSLAHYFGGKSQLIDHATIVLTQPFGFSTANLSIMLVGGVVLVLIVNALVLAYDLKIAEYENEKSRLLAERSQETLSIVKKVTEKLAVQYRESEEFNKKLFDTVANIVLVVDRFGYIVRINKAASVISGYAESELTGKSFSDILIPKAEKQAFDEIFAKIINRKYSERYQGSIVTMGGVNRLIDWYYTELLDENSQVEFIIATGTDITEQRLYEENMRLSAVAFETSEAICITDEDAKILRVNEAFTSITGYTEEESYGKNPSILKSGRHEKPFYEEMWKQIMEKGCWYGEVWNRRKNGEIYPEWLRITAVYDDSGKLTNYVATFSDTSEIKQAEEQIHFYSNFDATTKLPNSKLFTELVDKELEISRMKDRKGALLFVELIHLDKLTDNIGIGAVDSYINQLVNILYQHFGTELVIGRINNTDIAILLDDLADQKVISQSVDLAEEIIKIVKSGLFINDQMAYIHVNIGIIDYSGKDSYAEELLQHANTAANRARKIEHDSYQFYSSYMQKSAAENYQMEVALREAIKNNEFELLLQPQININDELIGAEALIRWRRNGEVVSPDKFIPIAEESSLIIDIGDWVLKRAMDYIATVESMQMPESFKGIAVNVSAIQIQQDNFLAKLKQLLIEKDILPSHLKLEITESAVLEKPHIVINKLAALKEIGVSVALDDFGTGYSSLSYLQKMRVDQLKIDRSFVTDLSINKTSQALTETIIVMAKNLGIEVIAEGVENHKERAILASYGCSQYQGYYYSRPIDFDAFLDYAKHPIQVEA